MRTTDELFEVLGEAEMAMISAEFWLSVDTKELVPDNRPKHPIWRELNTFQNGWLACKDFYKIRD